MHGGFELVRGVAGKPIRRIDLQYERVVELLSCLEMATMQQTEPGNSMRDLI